MLYGTLIQVHLIIELYKLKYVHMFIFYVKFMIHVC